ncbi:MAG: DNA repair protein, partial [Puniceicoccaceae bacterium]
RVFRWSLSADGTQVKYIDNRGERDIKLPPAYDFEWTKTTRDDVVNGKHPHINILDQIFIETVGGDLTVKVENNTKTGLGIYREPVDDDTQSIDDSDYYYAELGSLILLKILPYREEAWRYLVYNKLTQDVIRIDAIGSSCVQLPEDHGIVFPGGYYLQTGQYKTFDDTSNNMLYKRSIRSPNGEDVLYVFYEPQSGVVGLFAYNLIEKTLQNPIYGDGYALAEDGTMVIFVAQEEPTRIHPMQVWQTPFYSDEFASKEPPKQNFFGRIGNAELVRGISDFYAVSRIIDNQSVTLRLYEELRKAALKIFDDHYWIGEAEAADIQPLLKEIAQTSELAIDEFEKVQSIRNQSRRALDEAASEQATLIGQIRTGSWQTAEDYVTALDTIRRQRGHLATIKEYRYIDVARIDTLDQELVETESQLSARTIEFLADEQALEPYYQKIADFSKDVEQAQTTAQLSPILTSIEETASGLDLLSDLLTSIKVDDPTIRTRIIDGISQVYSRLNQSKASVSHKQRSMGSEEAVAQFSAQFKLFSQSITNALGLADSPEACDQQMSRLLIQLEELESQFADHDEFLSDIVAKREEIYESFESHKQQLLDNQQRRAQSVSDAANRILSSIERRTQKFTDPDEMNTFFASDALVLKVREFIQQLRQLDSNVQADDLESKSKAIRDQALRSLRDKSDLYESGGNVIKLGPKHRFSVNTQELDLTIIPRNNTLNLHLTGTDFYERIEDEALTRLKPFWQVTLESESDAVYRGEYLAASILQAAEAREGFDLDTLHQALLDEDALHKLVREYAAPRYKEGYERGIHDHDAALILKVLVPALEQADLLSFDPFCRGFAQVFWANLAQVHE